MSDRPVNVRGEERVMRLPGVVGVVFALVLSGCAGLGTPPPGAAPGSSAPQPGAEVIAPVAAPAPVPSAPLGTVATRPGIAASEAPSGSATKSTVASADQTAGKTAAPTVTAPAKTPAPRASAAQPSKSESIPPDAARAKAPPLDLASLERRLKDTQAIGVLTKITLKNQVDDLLDQFRAFYQGKLKSDLAALRRSYDLLVLKVLSLLQDRDQALAAAVAASREAIWGILSDPAKFATI